MICLCNKAHPKGLFVLFATEMWERFSYYGMRALLIFYLTKHFLFSDIEASIIYGSYTALVYILPIIGGILADRYLGAKKAVTYGAILIAIGHMALAFEGSPATYFNHTVERNDYHLQLFFLGLAFIAAGSGFLKANISTIVGALYGEKDSRRDSGFTIFYMGINLGGVLATLMCGYIGETYGWNYGFGAAGIGMLIGLVIFIVGQPLLRGISEPEKPELLQQKIAGIKRELWIYLGGFALVLVSWQLVQYHQVVGNLLSASTAVMSTVIIYYALRKCNSIERDRLLSACVLIFFFVVFWALFEQAGSSLSLLADRVIDRSMFGFEVKASQLQALNPAFIMLLAPVFSILWVKLAAKGWEPSLPTKFALGIAQVGLGFLVLVLGMKSAPDNAHVGLIWIALLYLIHTTGELSLSPVGLSMITKLSAKRIVGMMMGVWFLSISAAQYIAGIIASLTGHAEHGNRLSATLAETKASYIVVYSNVGWFAVGVGAFLLLFVPVLKKRMHLDMQLADTKLKNSSPVIN